MAVYTGAVGNAAQAGLISTSIRRKFIPRLINSLRFAEWAADGTISPMTGSSVLRWNLATDIATSTTALTEGTNPTTANTLTITYVECSVSEYGATVQLSSLANMVWTSESREEFANIFAHAAAKTIDQIIRNQCYLSGTYYVAGNATGTGSTTGTVTSSTAQAHDIAFLEGYFNQNDCVGFPQINGSYALIIHGKQEQDMKTNVTTTKLSWSNIFQNTDSGQQRITQGYIGTVLNTAVMRSNNLTTATVSSAAVTAYRGVALADHGVGKAHIGAEGKGFEIIMKQSGPQDTGNPLNMYSTLGWKATFGAKLLTPLAGTDRVVVYYSSIA